MDSLTALGAAALLARIGMVLYVTGLVRAKNSAGAVLRNIADFCLVTLAFWGIGLAILLQNHNAVFGIDWGHLIGLGKDIRGDFLFFQFVMVLTASGVVSGAVAERFRFAPLCASSVLLGAVIFPVAGNWGWNGWLLRMGFADIGGGTIFHVSAAACAAAGAVLIGPREGKYNRDGSSNMLPGHNVPFASLGALLMLLGMIPYVAGAGLIRLPVDPGLVVSRGSTNALVPVASAGVGAVNVLLCAAAAGVAAMFLSHLRYRKVDIGVVLMGFLGGLVASLAGANDTSNQAAVATGLVAGLLAPTVAVSLDMRFRIDDPAGVIAVHGFGGAWGTIAFALFHPAMSAGGRIHFVLVQILGVLSIAAFSAVVSAGLLLVSRRAWKVRPREEEEFDGLDISEHDIGAYPDFQQTTIKSYHLREA